MLVSLYSFFMFFLILSCHFAEENYQSFFWKFFEDCEKLQKGAKAADNSETVGLIMKQ